MIKNNPRMQSINNDKVKREKTYKREVSIALFAVFFFFVFHAVFFDNSRSMEMVKLLVTPIFLFAGGAYSIDSASKQFKKFHQNNHWQGYHQNPFDSYQNQNTYQGQEHTREDHGHGF